MAFTYLPNTLISQCLTLRTTLVLCNVPSPSPPPRERLFFPFCPRVQPPDARPPPASPLHQTVERITCSKRRPVKTEQTWAVGERGRGDASGQYQTDVCEMKQPGMHSCNISQGGAAWSCKPC